MTTTERGDAGRNLPSLRSIEERNALVEANLGLVGYWVDRFCRNRITCRQTRDDRSQAGMIGLIRAAELYSPLNGSTFATYASWWVKQMIWRHLHRENLIRSPWREDADGRIRCAAIVPTVSLTAAGGEDGDHDPCLIVDRDLRFATIRESDDRDDVEAFVRKHLDPRSATIFLRIVLDGMVLHEVGAEFGITPERVRQVFEAARWKLREIRLGTPKAGMKKKRSAMLATAAKRRRRQRREQQRRQQRRQSEPSGGEFVR